ncbi:hypothetical protein [Steroidobacter sp.]|uniref:chorismate transformation enzyme, FkbO/Hyg5 family n=1 Tax=Steroidobacter sp. TaxID=1978227 RepID=UPI001A50E016|nr:hypothetical protein [Steroidobacter sp.]MBL8267649.1 hypothetical protein [Steroidobacter sp.]
MRSSSGEQPIQSLPAALRVAYLPLDGATAWPANVLAAVRFGARPGEASDAALTIDVGLEPLHGPPSAELWFATGPVHTGQWSDAASGSQVRYAHDEQHLFAVVELDERQHGGILLTAEHAYGAIRRFQQQSRFGHLLRMWNYMDAINEGAGDLERYRQFCVGRGRGLGDGAQSYPSATAIGRHRPDHIVQVFWLAGIAPGQALENPRQVSAYHYPRVHGPVSPTFARALLAPDQTLLISGTASIVGHISQHHDDAMAQLEETVRNLGSFAPHVSPRRPDASKDLLKVYVRDPELTPSLAERLHQLYPDSEIIFVAADICRRELLLEIEAIVSG